MNRMKNTQSKYLWLALILSALIACDKSRIEVETERIAAAEKFFNAVWGCNPDVIDTLAAEDIVITYPIFEKLFGTTRLKGRDAVKNLSNSFCEKWMEAEITIHEKIFGNDKVVLLWSFSARYIGANGRLPANSEQSWGGITIFQFNEKGKIISEIGEESEPGPFKRLMIDDNQ